MRDTRYGQDITGKVRVFIMNNMRLWSSRRTETLVLCRPIQHALWSLESDQMVDSQLHGMGIESGSDDLRCDHLESRQKHDIDVDQHDNSRKKHDQRRQ